MISRRRRAAAFAVLIATAAVCGWAALAGADTPTGTLGSYALTPAGSLPADLTNGPDGNLWLVQPHADEIGTVTTSGTVTEHAITGASGSPVPPTAIVGATGATGLFFTESTGDFAALAEIATDGTVTPTTITRLVNPAGPMAADANGDLWIAHHNGSALAEVAPPYSTATPITLPAGADVTSITAGPGGQTMWFADSGNYAIGSIAEDGMVTEYPLSAISIFAPDLLGNIVLGADGNLWVGVVSVPLVSGPDQPGFAFDATLSVANAPVSDGPWVVRVTGSGAQTGTLTPYTLPSDSSANPLVLGAGPDGQIWMADLPANNGDLTAVSTAPQTAGTFTDYPGVLPQDATITSIVKDPGGADALWMSDKAENTVDRVELQADVSGTGPSGSTTGSTGTTGTTGATGTTGTTGATTPLPPGSTSTPPASGSPTAPTVSVSPPPPLTAKLAPISGVAKTDATAHGTISLAPGSSPTAVTYRFEYGVTASYGSTTADATATATPGGVEVDATLSGLDAYTTYHYRLLASDCGIACNAYSADATFTTGSTLQPAAGATVGAAPTSGEILIRLPGHHGFTRLAKGELVPLGATIDARHGSVLIQSATEAGRQASGRFHGGLFKVTQPRGSTVTVLVLQTSFASCAAPGPAAAPLARAASVKKKPSKKPTKKSSKKSHKVVNQVFGNAHGQFATQGQYATAADQGTLWRVSDRCDGTQIAVIAGKVTVTNLVNHHRLVLKGGHRYFVPGA